MYEDQYQNLKLELATAQFLAVMLDDYESRELDEPCKQTLKAAKEYFEKVVSALQVDLKFFTPIPREENND